VNDPKIEIVIKAKEGEKFEFSVKNLVSNERSGTKDPNSGIGIKNVTRRIDLLYPEAYKLLMKQENGFFEVYLELDLKNKT
jgi:sensor histidine kinase YesM